MLSRSWPSFRSAISSSCNLAATLVWFELRIALASASAAAMISSALIRACSVACLLIDLAAASSVSASNRAAETLVNALDN